MTFKIPFVEDLPTDVELAVFELRRARFEPVVRCVKTEDDFVRELNEFNPAVPAHRRGEHAVRLRDRPPLVPRA